MTRLLVAKIGSEYLRFVEERFELCSLAKASVFPETQADLLRRRLQACGELASTAQLMVLTITEQPYGG